MLTSPGDVTVVDDRPGFRSYAARVVSIRVLSPHFIRVTFTGPDFETFGTAGLDQRIKIVFPVGPGEFRGFGTLSSPGRESEEGDGGWYSRWRSLPEGERNPIRTYTVRGIRPRERELDVDFVTHGTAYGPYGPAARWLLTAVEGDSIVIVGPDERSSDSRLGLDWHPGDARSVLLAGDETAAPAICAILESLPTDTRARAFIEVPDAADTLDLDLHPDCHVSWLARGTAPHGSRVDAAVRQWVGRHRDLLVPVVLGAPQPLPDIDVDRELLWDSPAGEGGNDFYAWIAGEAGTVKRLRRFLVSETGIDRSRVAFMGYWRLGRAESQ